MDLGGSCIRVRVGESIGWVGEVKRGWESIGGLGVGFAFACRE